MKKVYAAIGHWRSNKNTVSAAITASTKKDAAEQFRGNEFVAYVILTEAMLNKMLGMYDCFERVKHLTSNYRIWNEVAEYIDQCGDILAGKVEAARSGTGRLAEVRRFAETLNEWNRRLERAEAVLADAKRVCERWPDDEDAKARLGMEQINVDRIREDMARLSPVMDTDKTADIFKKQAERNARRMNEDIDRTGGAYHLRDSDGNDFYFGGIESGFPVYRGDGGSTYIFGLAGYEVVEKYATA